jgi:hypothetical protein
LLEDGFKLGKDRSEGDRQGILSHLEKARGERSLSLRTDGQLLSTKGVTRCKLA